MYYDDLKWAATLGMQYLNKVAKRPGTKQKCVIFDIDDTLVFGDPDEVVGIREMELGEQEGQLVFIYPRNEPICKLAEFAKKLGILVIVLTARPPQSKIASKWNMNYLHIPYDILITNDQDKEACFKIKVRRNISQKYDILLTIGDQTTDCLCVGPNTASIKLPEPGSLCSYAWIPGGDQ
jgi:hypothetical protein